MHPTNVISISDITPTIEHRYRHIVNVLRRCGGFDLSNADKISLIRHTLRELGEEPTITPIIPQSP